MGWKKSIVDEVKLFTYSDKSLCKECSGYSWCPNFKDGEDCNIIEFSIDEYSLSTRLYSKERAHPDAVSCVELNFSKIKRDEATTIIKKIENIPKVREVIEKMERDGKLSGGLLEAIKHSLPDEIERFEMKYHRGEIEKKSYEFIDSNFFVSFLQKIPIVKNGEHPTINDLEFQIKTVKKEEFSGEYESLYKRLVDFANNNARTCED